jgi:uncharacterized membrane protein YphA (DoxX/SURF4 family)
LWVDVRAVAEWVLAFSFLWAGTAKMLAPEKLYSSLKSIGFARPRPISFTLIAMEIIVGVLFALGLHIRATSIATMLMLGVFTLYLLHAESRGLSHDCGCFGSWELGVRGRFLRNGAMFGLSALILVTAGDSSAHVTRSSRPIVGILLVAITVTATILVVRGRIKSLV